MVSQKRNVIFSILLSAIAPNAEVAFSTDVWPILERRCVACHQPVEIPLTPIAILYVLGGHTWRPFSLL